MTILEIVLLICLLVSLFFVWRFYTLFKRFEHAYYNQPTYQRSMLSVIEEVARVAVMATAAYYFVTAIRERLKSKPE